MFLWLGGDWTSLRTGGQVVLSFKIFFVCLFLCDHRSRWLPLLFFRFCVCEQKVCCVNQEPVVNGDSNKCCVYSLRKIWGDLQTIWLIYFTVQLNQHIYSEHDSFGKVSYYFFVCWQHNDLLFLFETEACSWKSRCSPAAIFISFFSCLLWCYSDATLLSYLTPWKVPFLNLLFVCLLAVVWEYLCPLIKRWITLDPDGKLISQDGIQAQEEKKKLFIFLFWNKQ